MGSLSVWHWLIIAAVLVLFFGASRLPNAARGVGRSLKILKAETKGLRDDDDDVSQSYETPDAKELPAAQPQASQAPQGDAQSSKAQPSNDQVADLQRQLDELKSRQANKSQAG